MDHWRAEQYTTSCESEGRIFCSAPTVRRIPSRHLTTPPPRQLHGQACVHERSISSMTGGRRPLHRAGAAVPSLRALERHSRYRFGHPWFSAPSARGFLEGLAIRHPSSSIRLFFSGPSFVAKTSFFIETSFFQDIFLVGTYFFVHLMLQPTALTLSGEGAAPRKRALTASAT